LSSCNTISSARAGSDDKMATAQIEIAASIRTEEKKYIFMK
jgi:hypothetical protein